MNAVKSLVLALALVPVLALAAPKNVIVMVPDGTGVATLTVARQVKGAPLALDKAIYGAVQTRSASSSITDSAAAATAMSCGERTYNGAVAVDTQKRPLKTFGEWAKENGKAVGIVTTDTIVGATPSGFSVHATQRKDADTLIESQIGSGFEVFLGGGRKHLTPERTAWLKERGYALPKTAAELRDAKGKIFGLFANDTMTAMVERRSGKPCDEPTLPEMAGKALEILSQDPDGFFLLIEGAQVDHGAHVHDLPWSVYELLTFDETVAQVLAFAEKNPDTVVLIAPDHETGGLTLCTTEPKEGARAEVIRATTSKRGKGVSSKDWFVKYTTGGHTGVDVFLAGNNRDVRPYLNCEFPKAIAGRDAERLPELQGKTVEADGATWLETADGKRLRANLDAIYVKDTGKWYARP